MGRREELLEGVKTLNRRPIDERDNSEEAAAAIRARVERESDKRKPSLPGVPGTRLQTDKSNLPENEVSLESLIQSQITGSEKSLVSIGLEIAHQQAIIKMLYNTQAKLRNKVKQANTALEAINGNDRRSNNAKDPIPKEEPGLKNETEEKS